MEKVKLYLDTRKKNKDFTYPIKLYIRHKGNPILIGTGMAALKNEWDNGFIKSGPNFKAKNAYLTGVVNVVYSLLLKLDVKDLTAAQLSEKIREEIAPRNTSSKSSVLKAFDEFIARKSNVGTKHIYITTRNKIEGLDPKINFEDIDVKWLTDFVNSMDGKKVNYIGLQLRNLRAVFNFAIDEDITTNYPFRKFKIKKEDTIKRSLSVEQLRLFMAFPAEKTLIKYRDIFMLSFYLLGVNMADLLTLTKDSLVDGRLNFHRAKTGNLLSVKVEPEAMEIINKYPGENYLLDVMDSYKNHRDFIKRINLALKKIGPTKRSGLGGKISVNPLFPDITTYWARHTWATLAADLEIPIATISAALGHSAGKETAWIYIRFNQTKVDVANRRVIDHVLGIAEK